MKKAATELKGINVQIGKVNADEDQNEPLAERYGIRGFPTLKVFRNGKESDYQGERTAESIVSYMRKQSLPAVSELHSVSEVEAFVAKERVVVVGFFNSKDGGDYFTFTNTANRLRDKRFLFGAIFNNAEVAQHFKAVGYNSKVSSAILFKQFDERRNEFSGDWEQFNTFVNTHSTPLIDEIGPENYRTYIETGIPLGYLFVDLSVEGQKDQYIELIRDSVKESKGKVNWVFIDFAKYAKHGERIGLSGKVVPSIAIDLATQNKHWAFPESETITKDSFAQWISKFLKDELDPTVKSEDEPADNTGPVKKLVAKNFEKVVLSNTKDVLVEFYAPWCGHCKSLAPIYEKLGEHFKDNDKIVIAQMDATANDVDPIYDVRGFPTIKFFPGFHKTETPNDYQGERTLDAFISFLTDNADNLQTEDHHAGHDHNAPGHTHDHDEL